MIENPNAKYNMNPRRYDVGYDDYMNFEKTYGHFGKDGETYVVTDRNTPRQWLNFMVNDTFASVAGNDGSGFTALNSFYLRITKFYCGADYLIRTLNGRRRIVLTDLETGALHDIFVDSKDMVYTVYPGSVNYQGTVGDLWFDVTIFVPENDNCESWIVRLSSKFGGKRFQLSVGEDLAFLHMYQSPKTAETKEEISLEMAEGSVIAVSQKTLDDRNVYACFGMEKGLVSTAVYDEKDDNGEVLTYRKIDISREVEIGEEVRNFYVVSGADFDKETCADMIRTYTNEAHVLKAKEKVDEKWDSILQRNRCKIPDESLQNFLNVWLKNQIYLTMRYNRFDIMGYRDVMQDSWGHLLVKPEDTKQPVLVALSKMYADGRCPRQYDRFSDMLDDRDFMDSPIWIPIMICDYVKETGDFSILEEKAGYLYSDKKDSVLDHILLSLDYLYHSRGKNGLILMRRGDWLDGLNGISQYGEATTVWGTIATYHAQNLMAELLCRIGQEDKAELMRARSAEYKEIVNTAGWDGNWYTYAFIDDEPIGSSRCQEGKIYLNAQSWAMLTGICDDSRRMEKMDRAISTYLMSMYGPHLMAPPYTKYGERCGRIQNQRPGTFANSAIYLHGAAFLAMAYCVRGKYDDALDVLQRILPTHRDNCDTRRTSEPYCIGNVYYGITHPCHGLNLFSWFTATPSWMIHCGFEALLGVKPEYDGLKIDLHEIEDWTEYSVTKHYRGTEYIIEFKKGKEKAIYVDGVRTEKHVIMSSNKTCQVTVTF